MAYIANKPVRFDRTYAIGEVIPDEVITPQMVRRLLDMGRILCVDLPAPGGGTEEPPVSEQKAAQNGAEDEGGVNNSGGRRNARRGRRGRHGGTFPGRAGSPRRGRRG